MKILQIFGAVAALHLLAFIFIFASPGCQSTPSNVPTPDATLPSGAASSGTVAAASSAPEMAPLPDNGAASGGLAPLTMPGRAEPTRPGSPNAAAITPVTPVAEGVAPVTTYTIRKGDSLWLIAKKNHITVGELTRANNITTSASLQPGKKLIIPGKIPPPVAPAPAPDGAAMSAAPAPLASAAEPKSVPAHASGEVVRHTVTSGESLSIIAHKYGITSGELAAANSISDPAKIRVGQTLVIPNAKSPGARAATKSAPKPAPVSAADKPAAPAVAPAAAKPVVDQNPHFELQPPPPGQDLDSGLKGTTTTEVPTVKVEEPKTDDSQKN